MNEEVDVEAARKMGQGLKGIALSVMVLSLSLSTIPGIAFAQQLSDYKGNAENRAQNVMSGNKVSTIFYNFGLVGRAVIGVRPTGEWPTGSGNDYIGDVTPLIAVEYEHPSGDTIHTVITCDSPRGATDTNSDGTGAVFEPLPGFHAEPLPDENALVAMSNQKETWPNFWPDKTLNDSKDQLWQRDNVDPGWAGAWNGYFGKDQFSADQETYFIVDDNADHEFQTEFLKTTAGLDSVDGEGNRIPVTYHPVATDTSRGGIGLRMAVRGFQWSHFLAEDCIFWHYEIANVSDYDYNKVAFGMVVGTLAGGDGDSEDDLAFFDPDNDITYSYDSDGVGNTSWQGSVGYIGYAFLESPGNPYDGIDNDNDAVGNGPVLTSAYLNEAAVTGLIYSVGEDLVLIDYDLFSDSSYYSDPMRGRTIVQMPDTGLIVQIHNETLHIYPNVAYIEDGGNGIDDNFNGLIDERIGEEVGGKRLDHVGLHYMDFFAGEGLDDLMIDEARDDGIDNDGDWDISTDDVGFDGKSGTGDEGEGDGVPTYGEPHFDKTDINESDQIGLTSFDYFSPPGALRMNDDAGGTLNGEGGIWGRMAPGKIDVIPGVAEDGDFLYGSGYFPLPSGKTERFSIALLFGEDLEDITNNKVTVQQIYDNNYTFVRPPEKPTVKGVAGDGRVTLYWDDVAESSYDPSMPVGNEYDFEGYKIYRATDSGFLENFIITDGKGRKVFHSPIAQFDLDNGNAGYFPEAAFGVSFYLGDDTGLQHVWTDTTVQNGQTYYYAVTSYDRGFSGIIDTSQAIFFPAECPKVITISTDGELNLDQNTVIATPTAPAAGYVPAVTGQSNHLVGSATGTVHTEIVDPSQVRDGQSYSIVFDEVNSSFFSDTAFVRDGESHDTLLVVDLSDPGIETRILDLYDSTYQALFEDPYFETWAKFRTVETTVLDGQRLYFLLPSRPGTQINSLSKWTSGVSDPDSLLGFSLQIFNAPTIGLTGERDYRNYEIIFYDDDVNMSSEVSLSTLHFNPEPTNCVVRDADSGEELPFIILDATASNDNRWNYSDERLVLFHKDAEGDTVVTWAIYAQSNYPAGEILGPVGGDTMNIRLYKPFASDDEFVYETTASHIEPNQIDMDRIGVYPNPYLAKSVQEPNDTFTEGRGERRINFIHLPAKCTIRIYNIRGELIRTIKHNEGITDGSAVWDLRSLDGLDVAYGIYIYHVESDYGDHVGKFAVIK